MKKIDQKLSPPNLSADARAERLAQALRANLRRRKVAAPASPQATPSEHPPPDAAD